MCFFVVLWFQISFALKSPRFSFGSLMFDSWIYVVGGRGKKSKMEKTFEMGNLNTGEGVVLAPMLLERRNVHVAHFRADVDEELRKFKWEAFVFFYFLLSYPITKISHHKIQLKKITIWKLINFGSISKFAVHINVNQSIYWIKNC